MRCGKCVSQIEVTAHLKQKIEQWSQVYAFRLTHLYEHEFPPGLTKFRMNLNDFYLPLRPYQYDFYIPHFVLKETFSDDLKKLFVSPKNISNTSKSIPTLPNLKEILMSNAEKELSKKYFRHILESIRD